MQPLIDGDILVYPDGKVWSCVSNKFLKPYPTKFGHLYITFRGNKYYVHRLVAQAFIPNPEAYPQVNHIDNNPSNNCFSNLEWCTQSHNMQHSYDTGRQPKRKEFVHPNSKFTDEEVLEIFHMLGSQRALAKRYGVSARTIGDIKRGHKYVRVTGKEVVCPTVNR